MSKRNKAASKHRRLLLHRSLDDEHDYRKGTKWLPVLRGMFVEMLPDRKIDRPTRTTAEQWDRKLGREAPEDKNV